MRRNFRDLSDENQHLQRRIRDMRGAAAVVPQDDAVPPMEPMDSMAQFDNENELLRTPGNPHWERRVCYILCSLLLQKFKF